MLSGCPTRSEVAFRMSFGHFMKLAGGKAYFWTFTCPEDCEDARFTADWNHFMVRVRRAYPKARGMRVFERTKRGRLHVHLVVDTFMAFSVLQGLREGLLIGKVMWAERVQGGCEDYLAKYMNKRSERMRGIRRWAKFGEWQSTRVRDIEVESHDSDVLRGLYKQAKEQNHPSPWVAVRQWRNEAKAALLGPRRGVTAFDLVAYQEARRDIDFPALRQALSGWVSPEDAAGVFPLQIGAIE